MLARLGHPIRRFIGALARAAADPTAYLPDRGRSPTDHPTVGVAGFYGWGNYGDELFWQVFREHLGSSMTLRNLLGPGELRARSSLRRAVRESDLVLVGGGDLVIPWRKSRYWSDHLLLRPVYVAGVGVPLWRDATPAGVKPLRRFFRHPSARLVAARDASSVDWITSQLEPGVPVRLTPDLVFALQVPAISERPAGPPIFGVNVRWRSEGPDDLSLVRELCERARAEGYRIRRIVLATGGVRRQDEEATARLGLDDTELVSTDDIDAISRAIGECRVFATMKFHGVIAAAIWGVTPIALKPSTKTRSFLAAVGRLDLLTSFDDPDLPAYAARDLAPISPEHVTRFRVDALAFLGELRTAMLEQAARGWGRSGG